MSLVELQRFAAHSDPKTTARYIKVNQDDLLAKVRSIDMKQAETKLNEQGSKRKRESKNALKQQG
jgi:hypothetical protein